MNFEVDFKEQTQYMIEKYFNGEKIDECYFVNYDIRIADKKGESNILSKSQSITKRQ